MSARYICRSTVLSSLAIALSQALIQLVVHGKQVKPSEKISGYVLSFEQSRR